MIKELLRLMKQTMDLELALFDDVLIGVLGKGSNIAIQALGAPPTSYFNSKEIEVEVPVQVLAKSEDQAEAMEAVQKIVDYWHKLMSYPQPVGGEFAFNNVNIETYVNFVDIDEDNSYIYTAVITANINY